VLRQVAGASAPKTLLTLDAAGRKQCHAAWKEWLTENQAKVDLSQVNLGLPLASPELRARQVAGLLFEFITKPDIAKIQRITDVPFFQSGQRIINTRQDWEDELKRDAAPEGIEFKFKVYKTQPVTDYLAETKD